MRLSGRGFFRASLSGHRLGTRHWPGGTPALVVSKEKAGICRLFFIATVCQDQKFASRGPKATATSPTAITATGRIQRS